VDLSFLPPNSGAVLFFYKVQPIPEIDTNQKPKIPSGKIISHEGNKGYE
jgi:hypothetical protein